MPTVIDSFVMSLKLDPKDFTEGQKKLTAGLRDIESKVEGQGKRIGESGASGFVAFMRAADRPLSAIREHFERLVTTTASNSPVRRNLVAIGTAGAEAGEGVARGAAAGTLALRAMGVAGLVAIAGVAVLDKSLRAVGQVAQKTFSVGVGAAAAGLPVGRFSAISQMVSRFGNVPQAETQSWLSRLGEEQGISRSGGSVAWMQNFYRYGHYRGPNLYNSSTEAILAAIANQFATEKLRPGFATRQQQVIAEGKGGYDFSEAESLALLTIGRNFKSDLAAQLARRTQETKAQYEAARKLGDAQKVLGQQWTAMSRDLLQLDPLFVQLLAMLTDIFKVVGWLAGSSLPGPRAHGPGKGPAPRGALKGIPWLPGAAQPGGTSDQRNWWQRFAPLRLGGKPAPVTSVLPAPGTPGAVTLARIMERDESEGRNVRNFHFGTRRTASGIWQITDTNWRAYGPKVGVDLNKYPTAMSAPLPMQTRVKNFMLYHTPMGLENWTGFDAKLLADVHAHRAEIYNDSNHHNTDVGDVHVHLTAPAGADPAHFAAAVAAAIKQQLQVSQANTATE